MLQHAETGIAGVYVKHFTYFFGYLPIVMDCTGDSNSPGFLEAKAMYPNASYVAVLMLFVMIGYRVTPSPYFDCPIITGKH